MWWAPCPLGSSQGEFWFRCRTLNPFLLPLACLSLQRDGSPPLLILSGYHRDEGEKCPGCRFRFEFSCCRNTEGAEHWQGRVDHGERGGFLLSDIWRITSGGKNTFRFEKSSQGVEKEEQEKWMRRREEWTVLLSAWGQRADAVWQMLLYLNLNVASLDLNWNLKWHLAGVPLQRCFFKVAFLIDGLRR